MEAHYSKVQNVPGKNLLGLSKAQFNAFERFSTQDNTVIPENSHFPLPVFMTQIVRNNKSWSHFPQAGHFEIWP